VFAQALAKDITDNVRIVNLPIEFGGDVTDFVNDRSSKEDALKKLIELANKTPKFEIESNGLTVEALLQTEFIHKQDIIGSGVLPHNSQLLIAGESGVGKSLLRLEIAIHLVMGWDWLSFKIPTSRKVLIMQYENSEKTEKIRLEHMMRGLGIKAFPPDKLSWIKRLKENRPDMSQKSGQERMLELVQGFKPEVVIYDCLSNIHSTNENDNVKMRNVLDGLTDINSKLGTACIVIHHFGKPGESETSSKWRIRGASAIIDWANCGFAYVNKPHEHKILRRLENIKMRDADKIKPILLERNEFFLCREVDEESIVPVQTIVDVITDFGGEMQNKELVSSVMEQSGCGEKTVRRAIKKAENDRYVMRYREGKNHFIKVVK
jgi:KaiC/GvpD/RAD55 family RecA-like ATPase